MLNENTKTIILVFITFPLIGFMIYGVFFTVSAQVDDGAIEPTATPLWRQIYVKYINPQAEERMRSNGQKEIVLYAEKKFIKDQNADAFHPFTDVVSVYEDKMNNQIVCNITNYYTANEENYIVYIKPYVIIDNSKISSGDFSRSNINSQIIVNKEDAKYGFSFQLNNITGKENIRFVGYDLSANFKMTSRNNIIFLENFGEINTQDLVDNNHTFAANSTEIKIPIDASKIKNGTVDTDPTFQIAPVSSQTIYNGTLGFVKTTKLMVGKIPATAAPGNNNIARVYEVYDISKIKVSNIQSINYSQNNTILTIAGAPWCLIQNMSANADGLSLSDAWTDASDGDVYVHNSLLNCSRLGVVSVFLTSNATTDLLSVITNAEQNFSIGIISNNETGTLNKSTVFANPQLIILTTANFSAPNISYQNNTPNCSVNSSFGSFPVNISIIDDWLRYFNYTFNSTNYSILNPNLFLYYNGENTAVDYAQDLETNDGALTNVTYSTGYYDSGFLFTGKGFIIPTHYTPGYFHMARTALTVQLKMKPINTNGNTGSGTAKGMTIFTMGDSSNGMMLRLNNTNLSLCTAINSVRKVINYTFPQDTNWHDITARFDGTTNSNESALFIDGVKVVTINFTTNNMASSATAPRIGQQASTSNACGTGAGNTIGFYNGTLDEIRFWNESRSDAEILMTNNSYLYFNGTTGWNFIITNTDLQYANHYQGYAIDIDGNQSNTSYCYYGFCYCVCQLPGAGDYVIQDKDVLCIDEDLYEYDFVWEFPNSSLEFRNSILANLRQELLPTPTPNP